MNHNQDSSSGRKKPKYSTKFQDMASIINAYLKEEDLNLNFSGYTKTVSRYFRVQEYDLYEVYQIMTECNLWSNYMADVENFIQMKFLEYKVETDRLCAFVQKKVIDYQLEQDVKVNKEKTKAFEVFYKQVIAQKIFFEKAFWHCYQVYGKGVHTLNYKDIN